MTPSASTTTKLTTASAIGGLVGAAVYRWLTARVSLGSIMRIGLVIETLTHLSLALTRSTAIALVVMLVFGVHAQVWGVTATILWNLLERLGMQPE